jgi:hypothetical protein
MVRHLVLFVAVLASLVGAENLRAQLSSPAFDPNCYFPNVDDPTGVTDYYGLKPEALLGNGLLNIGPAPGDSTPRLIFAGLGDNPLLLTEQRIPIGFSIEMEHPILMTRMIANPDHFGTKSWRLIATGHFHLRDRIDVLAQEGGGVFRIYWADEHGQYDSTRYSDLKSEFTGTYATGLESEPYTAYLSSDTVEDIVFGGDICYTKDSCFWMATMFHGGQSLYQKGTIAKSDSSIISNSSKENSAGLFWRTTQGDFRGVGRKDLITLTPSGIFYYRNDPPFDLKRFEQSVRYDTLISYADAPHFDYGASGGNFTTLAMPTTTQGHDDFVLICPMRDKTDGAIRVFRGGEHFGQTKLMLEAPDALLQQPGYYDWSMQTNGLTYISYLRDCGTMTGTKNHVLFAHASDYQSALHFWYVLGDAIDDKVDMFEPVARGGASLEPIDADGDRYADVILGMPYYNHPTNSSLVNCGALRIVYGTSRIPDRTRSVDRTPQASAMPRIYPNPADRHLTIDLGSDFSGRISVEIRNILGEVVFRAEQVYSDRVAQIGLALPELPQGTYMMTLARDGIKRGLRILIDR